VIDVERGYRRIDRPTAVLGVVFVLVLPLLMLVPDFPPYQHGVLAGLDRSRHHRRQHYQSARESGQIAPQLHEC